MKMQRQFSPDPSGCRPLLLVPPNLVKQGLPSLALGSDHVGAHFSVVSVVVSNDVLFVKNSKPDDRIVVGHNALSCSWSKASEALHI
jgi:hypothetical protein